MSLAVTSKQEASPLRKRKRSNFSASPRDSSYVQGDIIDTELEQRPKKRDKNINLPSTTPYIPVAYKGCKWPGLLPEVNIVVFGDSYSKSQSNGESPLWIEHLVKEASVDVHNFAFPSATVEDDLSDQLSSFFKRFPKKSQSNPVHALDPANTIYVLFLGINDCGRTSSDELEPIVEVLFDVVHDLYIKAGARNFVLVDVPPIDRAPSAVDSSDEIQTRVETWNDLLRTRAEEFATDSQQATVFVFSSQRIVTDVLDDPLEYDFTEDDATDEGGAIWEDDLHLTPAVHAILAEHFLSSLKEKDP